MNLFYDLGIHGAFAKSYAHICFGEISQIFEMEGLSCHLLAEIYTPIPECSVTSQVVQLEDTEFSSDVRVPGSHSAVGSGELHLLCQTFVVHDIKIFNNNNNNDGYFYVLFIQRANSHFI